MNRRFSCAFVVLVCLSVVTLQAGQGQLVVTVVPMVDADTPVLHKAVLPSGTLEPIGEIGFDVDAVAFDRQGRLFGVDGTLGVLVSIDTASGAGTIVGDLGVQFDDLTMGLAFDRDGRLWMAGYGLGQGHVLYEVDPGTGATRLIGELAENVTGGLAVAGDRLLGLGYELARIDRSSAKQELVGDNQGTGFLSVGMDSDAAGHLWSVRVCSVCAVPTEQVSVASVDRLTGEQRSVGPSLPAGTRGLAIRPGARRLDLPAVSPLAHTK